MKDNIRVSLTGAAVKKMTTEQWTSLRENICRDGHWDTAAKVVCWMDFDTLMVQPCDQEQRPLILIGIEKDGYTHS